MSDPILEARAALERVARPGDHGDVADAPGVILSERCGLGIVSILAGKGMAAAASQAAQAAFGAALPATPRRETSNGVAFVWTGPERWLAIAQDRSSEALACRLKEVFHSLAAIAEQGDGRAVIRIAGPRARDTLAKILTLDLHPRVFRPGDTAVTGAAHIEIQIWQLDEAPSYEIALFRGFAGSFWHWLTQSAAEYGYRIAAPE